MKLLLCKKCQDVVKLTKFERKCFCGECSGKYKDDGIHAEIVGEYAECIGFNNHSLRNAVLNKVLDTGTRFEAFVLPDKCKTLERK